MRRTLLMLMFCVFISFTVKAQTDSIVKEKIYKPVEVVPSFPGGVIAFFKFIEKNLRYPAAARKNNTSGKVTVIFVVERDGSLTDVKVRHGIGDGCDEEAQRIVKLSSPWKPGMQGGRPVRVAYSVPIYFALSN